MHLDAKYRDALRELLNIGAGRAAAELNSMVQSTIQLRVPALEVISVSELGTRSLLPDEPMATVRLPFSGTFAGEAVLGFPAASAANLVTLLSGDEEGDSDQNLRECTLTEVGNILLNSVMGTVANILAGEFEYEVPLYAEGESHMAFKKAHGEGATILVTKTRFSTAGHSIEGDIHVVLALGGFEQLVEAINGVDPDGAESAKCSVSA